MTLGDLTRAELASQPDCWRRARQIGTGNSALPAAGERVLMLGCGTSYYMGLAYAALREAARLGMTDAAVASEWAGDVAGRNYDRVIAISRSGTSIELLDAVSHVDADTPVVAVVGTPDSPLAERGQRQIVDLSFADEQSVVQTRFATTSLTVLRASLGEDIDKDIDAAREALDADLPTRPDQQLVMLGQGWGSALAQEAALKCREAASIWAEAYPSGEYRHGPLAVAGPGILVWGLTPLSAVLVSAIEATGAATEQPLTASPQAELVRVHRFAVDWALARGRNFDRLAHLSRSVLHI